MQPCIVGLAQRGVGLAVEKGQKGVTPAARDRRHLMQRAAGEHHGTADRRAIDLAAELRKLQIAAVVILIEIEGDGEAPVLRAGIDIVAMPVEMPADRAVVAGNDVTIHAGRGELKIRLYGGQQATAKLIAYRLTQLG